MGISIITGAAIETDQCSDKQLTYNISYNTPQRVKTAIITGASSGIGMATARQLAALGGYRLIITGRRSHRLEALKRELERTNNCQVMALCFDIRNKAEVQETIAQLEGEWRQVELLINNAGLAAGLEHIDCGDTDDWDRMIDTNVKGLLYITRAISPIMVENKRGHIINVGSIAGVQTYENGAAYCASKHAVHALSQGMRIDLLASGIKVSEIRPGMVETEFSNVRFHGDDERAASIYRGVTPLSGSDIADIIVWLVTQPQHVNINEIEVMPLQQANAFYTVRR